MNQDEQHLQLLSVFHYVIGGITALFSLLPLLHVGMGIAMLAIPGSFNSGQEVPPPVFAWMFIVMGTAFITLGMTLAGLMIGAGRCLARRRRHLFCLVVAGLECILMPVGTVLGVFSIIVLMRDSVKARFASPPAGQVG